MAPCRCCVCYLHGEELGDLPGELAAKRDVEEGEEKVPEEAVDKEESKELESELRLPLRDGAPVFKRVERARDAQEDAPVERLDQDSPQSRQDHHQHRLHRERVRTRVDVRPGRVEPHDDARQQQQLRRDDGDGHAALERALPTRVVERRLARVERDHLLAAEARRDALLLTNL
eukprot:2943341-Pleurochrysis_carterae.AAC.1